MRSAVMLASADAALCAAAEEALGSRAGEYHLIASAADGDRLETFFSAGSADYVILDSRLPGCNFERLVSDAGRRFGCAVQFLVCGAPEFAVIRAAVKAGASDFLSLPLAGDELLASLDRLREVRRASFSGEIASRRFYMADSSFDALKSYSLTLEQLNLTYGTHFVRGLFQMIFVKFDFPNSFERLNRENEPLVQGVRDYITSYFENECADIIFENKSDGVMVLLNYPEKQRKAAEQKILSLYDRVYVLVRSFRNLNTTLCVSQTVGDACEVWQIKEQVRDAEWSRMKFGLNKTIFWAPLPSGDEAAVRQKLARLSPEVNQSIEAPNIPDFRKKINEFYSLPPGMLVSHAARSFLKQVIAHIFKVYWDTIREFSDPTRSYDDIAYCLHLCTTFESHQLTMLARCTELFGQIAAQAEKNYSAPVSQAITYVKSNTDRAVMLEDVAPQVNLSPGYFSYLFKRETGRNFTQFVCEYKLSFACELLKNSNLNISEIACRVGIPDVRAFSKKFRAKNGMSPSRYKQLHRTGSAPLL